METPVRENQRTYTAITPGESVFDEGSAGKKTKDIRTTGDYAESVWPDTAELTVETNVKSAYRQQTVTENYPFSDAREFSSPEICRAINKKFAKTERSALMERAKELIQKTFTAKLDADEEIELEMVRWKIDMIEDAIYGPDLDELQDLVEMEKRAAKKISEFLDEAKSLMPWKRQTKGRTKTKHQIHRR